MKTIKYKVWLHLEVVTQEDGGEEEFENGDELILPLPVGLFDTYEEAERVMTRISEIHYEPDGPIDTSGPSLRYRDDGGTDGG